MEKRIYVAAIALMILPAAVFAQAANFDLRYDPMTATTVTGTVLANIAYNPGNPMMGPQAVLVQSGNQVYTVFLGPGMYLSQIGLNLSRGNVVTVTGSQRNIAGNTYLVASTVSTPNRSFALRNASGMPLYSMPSMMPPQMMPPPMMAPPVGTGPGAAFPAVMFDPSRLGSETGHIISTSQVQTSESPFPYVLAEIRPTDGYPNRVHVLLGPASYINQFGISLSHGAVVAVRGGFTNFQGRRTMVATSIAQGTNQAVLRTATGVPNWQTQMSGTQFQPAPPPPR